MVGGGGVPWPGLDDGGIPHPRGYPGQVLMGCTWDTPQLGLNDGGYPPHQDVAGVPHTLRWGTPPPSRPGRGTPLHSGMGYLPPPSRPGRGTPPHPGMGYPPDLGWGPPPPLTRQSSIASTCYAADGMPLAFTQEDLFVRLVFFFFWNYYT